MKNLVLSRLMPALLVLIPFISMALAPAPESERREALRSLVARADNGSPEAMYHLATLHDTGFDSIPIDSARSTALYLRSARAGFAPAMNYIGFRYFNGEFVDRNVDSALYWLAKAATAGDAKAANNLGYLLANSDAVTRDYPQAIFWLSKAADAGLPAGQSQLADLLRQGLGAPKDTLRAVALYSNAIEGGLQDAELKLLSMMGRKWENLSPDSALSLGRHYFYHRAPFIGVTLFENVISNPLPAPDDSSAYRRTIADAFALLGDAYSRGYGVEYNHERSIEYFLQAALLDNPSAQFVIGELLDIFPDALSEGEPLRMLLSHYGGAMHTPEGNRDKYSRKDCGEVPEEVFAATYWYEKAAASGISDAKTATESLLNSPARECPRL